MLDKLLDGFVDLCAREDTRKMLEQKIVDPAVRYLSERFQFGVKVFQAIAMLVALQTIVLIWICIKLR